MQPLQEYEFGILQSAIEHAINRVAKWRPLVFSSSDMRQEAWLVAMRAYRGGTTNPAEIQRRIERHFDGRSGLFARERARSTRELLNADILFGEDDPTLYDRAQ